MLVNIKLLVGHTIKKAVAFGSSPSDGFCVVVTDKDTFWIDEYGISKVDEQASLHGVPVSHLSIGEGKARDLLEQELEVRGAGFDRYLVAMDGSLSVWAVTRTDARGVMFGATIVESRINQSVVSEILEGQ